MTNNSTTIEMEKEENRIGIGHRLKTFVRTRWKEYKTICNRINQMADNKWIEGEVQQFIIGVLSAIIILNPFFLLFGIKGVQFCIVFMEITKKQAYHLVSTLTKKEKLIIFEIILFAILGCFFIVHNGNKTANNLIPITPPEVKEQPLAKRSVPEIRTNPTQKVDYSDEDISRILYTAYHEVGDKDNRSYYPKGDYVFVLKCAIKMIHNRVKSQYFENTVLEVLNSPNQFEGVTEEMNTNPKFNVESEEAKQIVLETLSDKSIDIPDNMYWEYSFEYYPDRYSSLSEDAFPIPPGEYYDECIEYLRENVSGPSSTAVYTTYTAVENFNGQYGRRIVIFMANPNGLH